MKALSANFKENQLPDFDAAMGVVMDTHVRIKALATIFQHMNNSCHTLDKPSDLMGIGDILKDYSEDLLLAYHSMDNFARSKKDESKG